MRLRRLEIENFRGVRSLDWRHIPTTVALVGPGDSGKSTILDAIERVLYARWNPTFDDVDFWNLDTAGLLIIRVTITDFPDEFYRESKYGLMLHAFDESSGVGQKASGVEGEEYALVVELCMDATLEPSWNIIDVDGVKHRFSSRDREALGMLRVGGYVDHHLSWSRGSVLSKLTERGDAVGTLLANITRQARSALDTEGLEKFAAAARKVESLGKGLGVALENQLVPHLDASSLSLAGGALSLHLGRVPARRSGLGTRRLLTVAMQREAALHSKLTLVDEFEHGLEPHRIRRLLRALKHEALEGTSPPLGQLFLTTHSPTVLSELEPSEVAIRRRASDGTVSVQCLPDLTKYILARTPDALLARRVIVAEGATEVGLCLGLDEAWTRESGLSFAYSGVAFVDGEGGTQPATLAGSLASLGYAVALLIDSDAKAKTGKAASATVLAWPGGVSTEQRLAFDLPQAALRELLLTAVNLGGRRVRDALAARLNMKLSEVETESLLDTAPEDDFRKAFGLVAKEANHAWFKSREKGVFLGQLVHQHWEKIVNTPTGQVISQLKRFAHE